MKLNVNGEIYPILIDKKSGNKNTYIRVKSDLTVLVTTNLYTNERSIQKLIDQNYEKIVKMLEAQKKKSKNNDGFYYLGKKYDIVYVEYCDISFGDKKVFLNRRLDIDKWYKEQAKILFLERLEFLYERFSRKISHPSLKIRKMTSRWGVCNTKLKSITLNLELMKRDIKYLDYVIIHELSHLIHANHSKAFWDLVEENMPEYRQYRKEMKEF